MPVYLYHDNPRDLGCMNASGMVGSVDVWRQPTLCVKTGGSGIAYERERIPIHRTIAVHKDRDDPLTARLQQARQAIDDLNTLWKTLTPTQQRTWTDYAKQLAVAEFHAFIKRNTTRIFAGLPPIATPDLD